MQTKNRLGQENYHTCNVWLPILTNLGCHFLVFPIGNGALGEVGLFLLLIDLHRSAGTHNATHNSISSDVKNSSATVQKPINGDNELESLRSSSTTKDSVVGGNHKNQSSGRNWSCSSRSNTGKDDEQEVRSGIGLNTIEVGQPDTGAREVDGGTVHVDGGSQRTDKVANVIRDQARTLDTTQGDRKGGST
eukprot:Nitzschia sp. Nitz4//scaffold539_size5834//3552//4124//NITZ4_009201-RA/size5834-est2genome-gene-0.5-mRNA-1//-1//CDS//3329554138//5322//frame0